MRIYCIHYNFMQFNVVYFEVLLKCIIHFNKRIIVFKNAMPSINDVSLKFALIILICHTQAV